MTTLLIDGTNLFTIQISGNPAQDGNGNPCGGVKGFLNALPHLVRLMKPTKVIIFFDGKGGSAKRREMLSEYKEGRRPATVVGRFYEFYDVEKAQENRQFQFHQLRECLDLLPVNVIVSKDFEADDGIGYLVKHREFFDLGHTYIVSCDRDFYQLVSSNVSIYNPMSKRIINTASILEEFGIHPQNWLFYRAVVGDKSDNVDGVKGFGPKTLLKLLDLQSSEHKFIPDDISDLFEASADIKDKTIVKRILTLNENKSKIERNWTIMSLDDPMIDMASKDKISNAITTFDPSYKKLDLYRTITKLSLSLNPLMFDDLRFLVK
jgi:5'-3' exonuclease